MEILDFLENPGLPKGPSCDNGPNTILIILNPDSGRGSSPARNAKKPSLFASTRFGPQNEAQFSNET
jgi:hypothetical protein